MGLSCCLTTQVSGTVIEYSTDSFAGRVGSAVSKCSGWNVAAGPNPTFAVLVTAPNHISIIVTQPFFCLSGEGVCA